MKRFHFPFSILAVFFIAAFVVNGCKAPSVGYQVAQFSSMRVMDFAPFYGSNCSPTSPMDAYWYPVGQNRSTLANAYGLTYGAASVYTNLIQPGNYNVLVTPHLISDSTDVKAAITLAPNQKYTLVVTRASSGQFGDTLIQDGATNPAPNLTYVRFMNLQPDAGPLTVRVNDPMTGDLINTSPEAFNQVSAYVPLQTALDTSYAFFVTNAANQTIARLSYQTFVGGNSYTLVYAGDLCETLKESLADSTKSAIDTLRLRAFDDNSLGNDLTNPISPTFRYNIVNDIIPYGSNGYSSSYSSDTSIGFLLNGGGFPEYYNFSIPPISAYQGGGVYTSPTSSGALEVNYQSAVVPTTLVIEGFATNGSGTNQQELFNAGTETKLNESILLLDTNYNKPFTILFYDTVTSLPDTILSNELSGTSHYALIPVTDQSVDTAVTIEFIAGIVATGTNKAAANNYSLFYVSPDGGGQVYTAASNALKGLASGKASGAPPQVPLRIPVAAGGTIQLDVMDSIGEGLNAASVRIPGNKTSFTAQAGGIYEIISVGSKLNPKLLVMHVNADTP
jgi:Domain of unknown function (DUF4397)